MKTLLRSLFAVLLIGSSAGCASQKRAPESSRSAESEVLHQQALKALEAGRFIIRVDEFHPDGEPVKMATDSYMLMRDGQCEIKFSPDFMTGSSTISRDNFTGLAEITKNDTKKNGDIDFLMNLKSDVQWRENKVLITLYKSTNQCYVQFQNEFNGRILRLKGYIHPLF